MTDPSPGREVAGAEGSNARALGTSAMSTPPTTRGDTATGGEATTRPFSGSDRILLRSRALAKRFGATAALVDCSLEIVAGEVHALLGENGSGKSTFAKLVTGVHEPSNGMLDVADDAGVTLRSPADARAHGIVAVYQDILIAPDLSVLDNIWLGSDGLFRSRKSQAVKRRSASAMLTSLLGREVDLTARADSLSLSDQQACCIARALVQEFEVLVLDEATSSLDLQSRNLLFDIVRRLTGQGKGVLFVSHRMDEIYEIADRLTIIRSGRTVATMPSNEADETRLLALLTGTDPIAFEREAEDRRRAGRVSMRVRGLELAVGAESLDVDIYQGQILALAGLEGHGQDDFLTALWGTAVTTGKVYAVSGESDIEVSSPYTAEKLGIAYVPRDRRTEAMFGELSLRQNFELPSLAMDLKLGLIVNRRTEARFKSFAAALGLRYGRSTDPITSLSGGNQQKVVLGRWLALSPRVLLLNDPTRGVDLGTKREIYSLLKGLRESEVTVVLLSSEIDELLEVADRVLVFRNRAVGKDLSGDDVRREAILGAYFGLKEER